ERITFRMRSLLLLSSLFFIVNSAKIAVFLNAMSNSHVIFTIRVAEELAADHDVVIVRPTVNPKATTIVSNHPRVLEIRTNGASAETFASHKEIERNMVWTDASYKDIAAMSASYTKIFSEYCTSLINDEDNMAKLRAEKFDFALAHHIDLCPVSVINALEIPHFGFIMSIPLNRMWVNIAGVPMLSSIYPMIMMDATNEMNFLQRFKNFVLDVMMGTIGGPMQAKPINGVMRKKYGEAFPDAMELAAMAKFVLVNAHPDIEFPLPLTSKIGYFGGLGMSNESKPLIEPYSSFIESAKSIVFVSFGTVADPAMMPISWKNAFLELFEKNPDVHFIWRMVDGVTVPKNVLINTWHPQNDILAHPKTVAFITHAGYNSIGESIASGTPLITIPLAADQFRNSRLVEYRGFGVRVDKIRSQ
ncbi:hypothetical protein PRIPAC_79943, partial [Pristionchus pacificus]|uniref:UDP-glucuronosyltransferase n=1 Tax=Pristionchus pacificus TaxID=54126 RepID=A0A2A6C3Z4_PRIPA